jgi:hypothetical protein
MHGSGVWRAAKSGAPETLVAHLGATPEAATAAHHIVEEHNREIAELAAQGHWQ